MSSAIRIALAVTAMTTPAAANVGDTGTFETSITVDVPAYYDLTPRVSLGYSSSGGNGPVGVGWRLVAGSTIRRLSSSYGAPHYDATDVFFVDGQELVPCAGIQNDAACDAGATHAFRIETFRKVVFDASANTWTITDKDGTTHHYSPQLGFAATYTWAVDKITDRVGHAVSYSYTCDGNRACYLDTISYGDGVSCKASGPVGARIKFDWQRRTDVVSVATGGGFEETYHRLQRITVSHGGAQARAYQLDYVQAIGNGASLLRDVRELGSDNRTLGKTRSFDYPSASAAMAPSAASTNTSGTFLLGPFVPTPQQLGATWSSAMNPVLGPPADGFVRYADVDGDGRADYIHAEFSNHCATLTITTRLAGASQDDVQYYSWPARSPPFSLPGSPPSVCASSMAVADLDGDGRVDLVWENWPSTASSGSNLITMMGTGTSFAPPSNEVTSSIIPQADNDGRCAVGDVNGDGRADYVCEWTWPTLPEVFVTAEISLGDGTFQELTTSTIPSNDVVQQRLTLVDVNGDGLDDIVLVALAGDPGAPLSAENCDPDGVCWHWQLITAIGDGRGGFVWEPAQDTTMNAIGTWDQDPYATTSVFAGDFDGDGRRDVMITVQTDSRTRIQLALGRGTGTMRWATSEETVVGLTQQSVLAVGDTDLDSTTDLMIAIHHNNYTGCNPTLPGHFEVRSQSRVANGTFFNNTTFDEDMQCGDVLMTTHKPTPVDANADGRPDWIAWTEAGNGMVTLSDQPASDVTFGKRAWQRADVNGDGREDWVAVVYGNPGIEVATVITQPDGSLVRMPDVRIAPSGLGESRTADSTRQWFAIDVGGPQGVPDGRTDLVVIDDRARTITTLLSNGDGTYTTVVRAHTYSVLKTPECWIPLDFDGDGRVDLVRLVPTSVPNGTGSWPAVAVLTLRAVGDGTWQQPAGATSRVFVGQGSARLSSFRAIDFDGDGRGDLVQIDSVPTGSTFTTTIRTLRSTGDGLFTDATTPFAQSFPDGEHYQVVDINGDGRGDLARIDLVGGAWTVSYALGAGDATFANLVSTAIDQMLPPAAGEQRRFFAADLDQDGRADFYSLMIDDTSGSAVTTLQVVANTATGFVAQMPVGLAVSGRDTPQFQLDDWASDGRPDLIRLGDTTDHVVFGAPASRMTTFHNGTGATTTITYATSAGLGGNLPPGVVLPVVASVSSNDDVRGAAIESSSYAYGSLFYDYSHHKSVGFTVVETDGARSRTVTAHQVDSHCGARVTTTEVGDLAGSLISRSSWSFVPDSSTGAAPFSCLVQDHTEEQCEGTRSCLVTADHSYYDAFGNVVERWEEGDVGDSTDDRVTITPVQANTTSWIVSRPAYREVIGRAQIGGVWQWQLFAYTQHLYDNATSSSVPPSVGLLTAEERWDDQNGNFIVDKIAYDNFGNPVTRTGPPTPYAPTGRQQTFTYDCAFHRFPIRTCDGVGCTSTTWNTTFGLPATTTDLNAGHTTTSYDVFGRAIRVDHPDASYEVITPPDWSTPAAGQHERRAISDGSPGDGVLWTDHYLDGLARPWRTVEEGGRTTDVDYDGASNRVVRASNPYLTGQSPLWTTTAYDAANRRTLVTAPDGTTRTTSYQVGAMTTTDERGATRVTYFDGFGRISGVAEHQRVPCGLDRCPPDLVFLTTYGWDALDRGIWIRDANGNMSTWRFDSLSNRLEACLVDRGCDEYTFADDGLPVDHHDALGNAHHTDYDGSGRAKYRTSSDATGALTRSVTITWDRDPATGQPSGASIGRIVRIDDTSTVGVSRSRAYDAMGRVTTEQDCVASTCMTTTNAYDIAGRPSRVTYPNTSYVDYVYDARGLLAQLPGYATFGYADATNVPTTTTFANGVIETHVHDPSRSWLTNITMTANNGGFAETIGYDGTGRVSSTATARGTARPVSTKYGYDDLGRMVSVKSTDPTLAASYSYDGIGNMIQDSVRGAISHTDPAHPHAPTASASGQTFTYDRLGQLFHSSTRDLQWNADGNPIAITDHLTGRVTTYAYDVDGNRVMRTNAAGNEMWFSPMVERDTFGNLVTYVVVNGQPIARTDATGTTYLHRDHLGSVRTLSDAGGMIVDARDYTTWGTNVTPFATKVIAGFAGAEQDDDHGLVHMGARYYDPAAGVFASADTVIPNEFLPQTLNAYAYALNAPASLVDPDGHDPLEAPFYQDSEGSLGIGIDLSNVGEAPEPPFVLDPDGSFGIGLDLRDSQQTSSSDAPVRIDLVPKPSPEPEPAPERVTRILHEAPADNPITLVGGDLSARHATLTDGEGDMVAKRAKDTAVILDVLQPIVPVKLSPEQRRGFADMLTNIWLGNSDLRVEHPTPFEAFGAIDPVSHAPSAIPNSPTFSVTFTSDQIGRALERITPFLDNQ